MRRRRCGLRYSPQRATRADRATRTIFKLSRPVAALQSRDSRRPMCYLQGARIGRVIGGIHTDMPKMIWDESYWLQRAEEARTISADLRSPECRQIMREMAASYERLAQLTKDFRRAAISQDRTRPRRDVDPSIGYD